MTIDEIKEIDKDLEENFTCMAHDFDGANCSAGTIASHSISRIAQLSKIAEKNKVRVLYKDIAEMFHLMNESGGKQKASFKDWTIKKASTFRGFCNHHDTLLFNRMDKPIDSFDKETILQLHYRSVCYEYYYKKNSIAFFEKIFDREDVRQNVFFDELNLFVDDLYLGLSDIKRQKDICEKNYPIKNTSGDVKAVVFRFDVAVPVMCVGGWCPTYTIDKREHLFTEDGVSQGPFVGMSLGLDANGKSFWALTYTEDDKSCSVQRFIASLKKYEQKNFLDIAVLFCLQKSQNVCCMPSWHDGLRSWQKRLIQRGFDTLEEKKYEPVVGVNLLNKGRLAQKIIV